MLDFCVSLCFQFLKEERLRKENKYMPSPVSTALNTGLTSFVTSAQAEFVNLLPIALGLAITVAVTFMAIRYFRGIVKI